MTDNRDNRPYEDDARLDAAIADAWSDVKATDELLASTMSAIRAARDSEPAAEEKAATSTSHADSAGFPVSSIPSVAKVRPLRRHRLAMGLAAAAICLVFVGVGGAALYHTETAYASINAQTSITLGINRFGQIISVTSSDGMLPEPVDSLGLVGRSYEDGMTVLADSGILDDRVDVSVGSEDGSQQDSLQAASTDCLAKAGYSGTCNGKGYGRNGDAGSADASDSSQQGSGQPSQDAGMVGQGSGSGSGSGANVGGGNGNRWGATD
jgi:hypothetical protein